MGVSIAAGAVDQVGTDDDTFMTLGYSVGGVNLVMVTMIQMKMSQLQSV